MPKLNPLNIKTKGQTTLSIAILHSPRFRQSRMQTKEGRRLYNKELRMVKRAIKKFKIELNKSLPKKVKV